MKVASEAGVSSTCEGFDIGVQALQDVSDIDEGGAIVYSNRGMSKLYSWWTSYNEMC